MPALLRLLGQRNLLGPPWTLFPAEEDTNLSPAEAVFGTPLVLPNELLQAEETSFDQILKKFPQS